MIKKYYIKAKFTTTLDFPIIEAKSKSEAIEKAELLLMTDRHIEESQDCDPTWEVDILTDN
jgi:hypothetical protein